MSMAVTQSCVLQSDSSPHNATEPKSGHRHVQQTTLLVGQWSLGTCLWLMSLCAKSVYMHEGMDAAAVCLLQLNLQNDVPTMPLNPRVVGLMPFSATL